MKTALITGASSGIGKALAYLFAKDGHRVVLAARSADKLKAIAADIKVKYNTEADSISCDLSQPDAAKELAAQLKSRNITIDFLVNNAGFGDSGYFAETSWEKEHAMITVNITALTQLTKIFVQDMLKTGSGKILNLSSTAAFLPGPKMAVYYATKAYVESFSEAIAHELKDKNITVTALCPGPTASGFQDASNINDSRLVKGRKIPTAEEVAAYGYKAMMKGKRVAIHGLLNNLMMLSIRFSPRNLVTSVVAFMNGSAK